MVKLQFLVTSVSAAMLLASCSGGGAPTTPATTAPTPPAPATTAAEPAAAPTAGSGAPAPGPAIDVAALLADPSLAVDVPTPDEMFTAMQRAEAKAGRTVSWTSLTPARPPALPAERSKLALRLGAVMSDFFAAVQARDAVAASAAADEMKTIGDTLGLTAEIGESHARAKTAIAQGSWGVIRQELQLAYSTVRDRLGAMSDPELGYLVGAGLWIRGVELGTSYLKEPASWSREGAGMLRQGQVAGTIAAALGSIKGALASDPTVAQVSSGLRGMQPRLDFDRQSPPDAATIATLHADVTAVRALFL
jgi:hypothetical protein